MALRERVVAAVDGGMPRREAVRTFRVSMATIKRYLQRRRERGSLALAAQVAAHPDDTLAQHAATWRAEQGAAVSLWAVGRALVRAKITRKKSR